MDKKDIPIAAVSVDDEVIAEVSDTLRSRQLAQGPKVKELESLACAMAQTKHAVAVCNGTVALEAALAALQIGPGDEVITSPLTFGATLNAILFSGASVRFADIGDDFTLSPIAFEDTITRKTKAVVPVHLYGLMADMTNISRVAAEKGLAVIEDAAQAHGAELFGKRAGSFGVGCFSLYATKNVAAGEGGLVTTDSDEIADWLRVYRNQGMRDRYEYVSLGRNLRMTDVCAAIAIPRMKRLGEINRRRRENAALLTDLLSGVNVTTPTVPVGHEHAWHQYTVVLPAGVNRRDVIESLRAKGIGCDAYYPKLVWDYRPFRENERVHVGHTPKASSLVDRILSIPVHQELSLADVERVANAVRNSVG